MRAVRIALGIAAGVAVLGIAFVYGVSEWRIRRHYDVPLVPLRAASPADPVAGEHMAKVVGCWAASSATAEAPPA